MIVDGYNIIYKWPRLKKHMIKGDVRVVLFCFVVDRFRPLRRVGFHCFQYSLDIFHFIDGLILCFALFGKTARARQLLVDDLENLRSNKGWRIEVVFDGAGRRRSSSHGPLGDGPRSSTSSATTTKADRALSKEVSKFGVRSIYTGAGVEADSYIEERCARAKNVTGGSKTGMFIVATVREFTRKLQSWLIVISSCLVYFYKLPSRMMP